ncbi:MAG: hypothetical protein ABSD42_00195 [Candidatus Bathyarchaeia archaeon]
MPEIVKQRLIDVDKKVAGSVKLPRTLILFNVDANNFVLSSSPWKV